MNNVQFPLPVKIDNCILNLHVSGATSYYIDFKIHSKYKKSNVFSLDIETYGDIKTKNNTPYLICFYYKGVIYIESGEECIINMIFNFERIIDVLDPCIEVYIHNISFDYSFILKESLNNEHIYKKRGISIKYALLDTSVGGVVSFTLEIYNNITNIRKTIIFKDSYKLFPTKLEKAGNLINFKKMYFPDYNIKPNDLLNWYEMGTVSSINNIEKSFLEDHSNIIKIDGYFCFINLYIYSMLYCTVDVLIVSLFVPTYYEILTKDLKFKTMKSSLPYTMGSLALQIFNEIERKSDLKINMNLTEIEKFYGKKCYYGGSVGAYGNLDKNEVCVHYDFVSMYPSRMEECEFPTGSPISWMPGDNITKLGIYEVIVNIPDSVNLPVLPYIVKKHKDGNFSRKFYPVGTFKTTITGIEALYCMENGYDIQVISGIYYENGFYPFKKFVSHFKHFRTLGDVNKEVGKLLLNSLYGKLAQKQYGLSLVIMDKNHFDKHSDVLKEKYGVTDRNITKKHVIFFIDNKTFKEIKEKEIKVDILKAMNKYCIKSGKNFLKNVDKKEEIKGNIVVAAMITAAARITLHRTIMELQKMGLRILYSDTDSIYAACHKDEIFNFLDRPLGTYAIIFDSNKDDTIISTAIFIRSKFYFVYQEKDKKWKKKVSGDNKNGDNSDIETIFNDIVTKFYQNGVKAFYNSSGKLFLKNNKDLSSMFLIVTKKFSIQMHDRKWSDSKITSTPYKVHDYTIFDLNGTPYEWK